MIRKLLRRLAVWAIGSCRRRNLLRYFFQELSCFIDVFNALQRRESIDNCPPVALAC